MFKQFIFLFLIFITCLSSVFAQNHITVVTYNIWYDNPSNTENPWNERKNGVIETLQRLNADIFCVQEALIHQVHDLEFDNYKHAGVGRDDGKETGEYSAIFYDSTSFKKLNESSFWLSETPDMAGKKGWDAVCVRIATWVHLIEIKSGKTFFVFNTHFDHIGDTARLESAKLLKLKIEQIADNKPVILTGDFNCKPGSKPYKVLTAENSNVKFVDSRLVSKASNTGPDYTYVGSDFMGNSGDLIDHIFVSEMIQVENAFIDLNCNDKCPSDHLPVVVNLILP